MVHTIVLFVAQVNRAAAAAPAIGVDDAIRIYLATNDGLERLSGTVRHDFGIDTISPLQDAKHGRFPVSTAAAVSL